jgi:opacity protein-like surface antigen
MPFSMKLLAIALLAALGIGSQAQAADAVATVFNATSNL